MTLLRGVVSGEGNGGEKKRDLGWISRQDKLPERGVEVRGVAGGKKKQHVIEEDVFPVTET